jgi:hypothetical protein
MEERKFRMDKLSDLSPVLRREDCLLKADICDAYYHLRLRKEDELYLSFCVGGVVYVLARLKCGLSVVPWFVTKAMRPVVALLRSMGHRVFSYIDDFFGAGRTARNDHPATVADTMRVERDIHALFARLGLALHPTKCDFSGAQSLEILGILVNTRPAKFLLSAQKLRKVEVAAQCLLSYARPHRMHVPARALRSFAGLGNSTGHAVVDARLRLRELFDALSLAGRPAEISKLGGRAGERRDPTWPETFLRSLHAFTGRCRRLRRQKKSFGASTSRAPSSWQPRISHAGIRDLQWWDSLSTNPHVGREVWPAPTAALFTDASMRGWGAV